jgi:hypothetical protein
VARIPLALPVLSGIYDRIHGSSIYTSLIVLQKQVPAPEGAMGSAVEAHLR